MIDYILLYLVGALLNVLMIIKMNARTGATISNIELFEIALMSWIFTFVIAYKIFYMIQNPIKDVPAKGEIWFLKDDGSPFDTDEYYVEVTDNKDGWVRYDSDFLKNQRMKTDSFIYCYERG